jgi:hypothetical protein
LIKIHPKKINSPGIGFLSYKKFIRNRHFCIYKSYMGNLKLTYKQMMVVYAV